ncbi:MAG: hypothetical protein KDA78_12820 [Planctomycetaceae bacterium]|nr:hypothetical protein [Planctomycetaceae bacterium]
MDAQIRRMGCALLSLCSFLIISQTTLGARFATPNFVVEAPTPEFAEKVAREAERFRKELAVLWAGQEMPNWSAPCPIRCRVGQIGAGGATTFNFQNGEVLGWNMNIQGTEERILDSVLPHEVTHTVLACIFRRPLPRWADEGMSTLIEHESERRRQTRLLDDVMRTGRKIPLNSLLAMTEYPSDGREVMKLYAQGYSLTDYLVQQGGRNRFLRFLQDAHRHGSWDQSLSAHYGVNSIQTLEQKWGSWVIAGSPELRLPEGQQLALNESRSAEGSVVRGQTPDKPLTGIAAPHPTPGQQRTVADSSSQNDLAAVTHSEGEPARAADLQSETHQAARSRSDLSLPVYFRVAKRLISQYLSDE